MSRRAGGWSTALVGATLVSLLVGVVPAEAAPRERDPRPSPAADEPASSEPVDGDGQPESVPAEIPGDEAEPNSQERPRPSEPRSGSARVRLVPGEWTRAGELPVLLRHGDDDTSETTVRVHLQADERVKRRGGVLALRVQPVGSKRAEGKVRVRLDTRGLAGLYGGNFVDRLRLYGVPACVLSNGAAPEKNPHCQDRSDLGGSFDEVGEGYLDFTADLDPEPGAPEPDSPETDPGEGTEPGDPGLPEEEPSPTAEPAAHPAGESTSEPAAQTASSPAASPGSESAGGDGSDKPGKRHGNGNGNNVRVGSSSGSGAGGTSYLLSAGPAGSAGSFTATPLTPSSRWSVGEQTGNFATAYSVPVPPAPGGAAPEVALTYSSGSVDGRTAATNNQASWVGMGWDYQPGFVERRYGSCSDDGHSSMGDLCWAGEHVVLHLGGQATPVYRHPTTGAWRLADDSGWRVRKATGAANGDNDGEHWILTDLEGTSYVFGLGKEPTSGEATGSAWTVPVFGDDAGEPCRASTLAASYCTQAWRWNLDRVVDRHGNVTTLYWGTERNSYGRQASANRPTSYVRGGWLSRIDYGQRAGAEGQPAAARVSFDVQPRCLPSSSACPALTKEHASSYPDVPVDLICSTSCTDRYSPVFFGSKRLAAIRTSTWNGAVYRTVDEVTLRHLFPSPGDGSDPTLWLAAISRKAMGTSSTPNLVLPQVRFSGVRLTNRVDANPAAGVLPIAMYRINGIRSELGGLTRVTYGRPRACVASALPHPATNTRDCYPQFWVPKSGPAGFGWYHKNLVTKVEVFDNLPSTPSQLTSYTYEDGAAWHHDDDPVAPARTQSWGQYRGYGSVLVTVGTDEATRSRTRRLFLRGMDGDRQPGGVRSVVVVDSDGRQTRDHNALAGRLREERRFNSAGVELEGELHAYWLRTTIDGTGQRDAVMVRESAVEQRVRTVAHDSPTTVRTVRSGVGVTFEPSYGLPVRVVERGDLSTVADDTCTTVERAANASAYLVDFPFRTTSRAGSCTGTILSRTDVLYDRQTTLGAAPTRGDAVEVRRYVTNAGSYVRTRFSYDALGRVTGQRDGRGHLTSLSYRPATGALRELTTTRWRDASTPVRTTTAIEPERGLATVSVDPNGRRTETAYDALGRPTAVWLPDQVRAQGSSPSQRITYRLSQTGPSSVVTEVRQSATSWLRSVGYVDGLGRTTETQVPAQSGGRTVVSSRYDERGLLAAQTAPVGDAQAPGSGMMRPLSADVPSETRYRYDELGREVEEALYSRDALQRRTTTVHLGNGTISQPPAGRPTVQLLDGRGLLSEVREPQDGGGAAVTRYQHTLLGQLARTTNDAGHVWTHQYDLLGRSVVSSDPDAGRTTRVYDAVGNVVRTTDGLGTAVDTVYDAFSRPVRRTSGGQTLAEFTYDGDGRLGLPRSATRISGGLKFTTTVDSYDARYRPTRRTWTLPASAGPLAGSYSFGFGYDDADRLVRLDSPAAGGLPAETVTTGYDAHGFATTLSSELDTYVAASSYDGTGQLTQRLLGTGAGQITRSYGYQPVTGELTRLTALRSGTALQDNVYDHDLAGNLTSITDELTGQRECARYDGRNRLVEAFTTGEACTSEARPSASGPDPYALRYSYDRLGRITGRTDTAGTHAYTYPAAGQPRPHAVTTAGGDSFDYDAAGRMTRRTVNGRTSALRWDVEHRLVGIDTADQDTDLVYDTGGERLLRTRGEQITAYLPGLELHSRAGSVTATRFYSHDGATVALRSTDPASPGLRWLLGDHHGSASVSIDQSTGAVSRQRYLPYGGVRSAGQLGTDRGYLSRPADEDGLLALGARHYDPMLGRFLSPDPVLLPGAPASFDAYGYATGNPFTYDDRTGLFCGRCPSLRQVSNFAAGFGDTITFGGTRRIRQAMGVDDVVDRDSGSYRWGGRTGMAAELGAAVATGGLSAAAKGAVGAARAVRATQVAHGTVGAVRVGARSAVSAARAGTAKAATAVRAAPSAARAKVGARRVPAAEGLSSPGALRRAAVDVHDLATPSIRHNMSTVALAEVRMPAGGTQVFASGSSGRLSGAQVARLEELGVPSSNILRGPAHAEINVLNGLPEGAVPVRWGIAWAGGNKPVPCPACAPFVKGTVEGAG